MQVLVCDLAWLSSLELEVGSWKLEVGSWKLGVGSWELPTKLEVMDIKNYYFITEL